MSRKLHLYKVNAYLKLVWSCEHIACCFPGMYECCVAVGIVPGEKLLIITVTTIEGNNINTWKKTVFSPGHFSNVFFTSHAYQCWDVDYFGFLCHCSEQTQWCMVYWTPAITVRLYDVVSSPMSHCSCPLHQKYSWGCSWGELKLEIIYLRSIL